MAQRKVATAASFKEIVREVFHAREWTLPMLEEYRTEQGHRWYKSIRVKVWTMREMNVFIDYRLGDVSCYFSGKDTMHSQREVGPADLHQMARALEVAAVIVEIYYDRLHAEQGVSCPP